MTYHCNRDSCKHLISMAGHVQVKLITKQIEYAIPDFPFSLEGSVTVSKLNSIIKSVLQGSGTRNFKNVEFEFLVLGELLRHSLDEHLEAKQISTDSVIDIEYFTKLPAPSPENSLNHDDWVGGVKIKGNWILSGCYDSTLHLWNVDATHKLTITGHEEPVRSVAWIEVGYPHSTFISTSMDNTARLWQWNQESNLVNCVNVCEGHNHIVHCSDATVKQHMFATGSSDKTINIWSSDLHTDEEGSSNNSEGSRKRQKKEIGKTKIKVPLITLTGHNSGVYGIQWIGSNELCSVSWDATIKIWDIELQGLKSQLNGSKAFLGVSYSPVSTMLLTASADRYIRLWDPRSQEGNIVKSVFTSHTGWIYAVKWSPSNQFNFVSCSQDQIVKLWDIRSPKAPLYDMCGHEDKIFAVDWSEEDYIVSGGADNQVKVFKAQKALPEINMQ